MGHNTRHDEHMKLYADLPARRTRQIIWDLLGLAFIVFWVWLGVTVYHGVNELGAVGEQMESVGASLAQNLTDMGDKLGSIPLIGDGIRAPFDAASGGAQNIEQAGKDQQEFINNLAWLVSIGLVIAPILATLCLWLIPRGKFVAAARRIRAVAATPGGDDLLALRALARRSLNELASVGPDVAQGWRRGETEVIAALAALEKRAAGLVIRAAPPATPVLE